MKYPVILIVCALATLWFTRPASNMNHCLKYNTVAMCAILEAE
ncbi:conserved hypothetical protein [Vibrio phage 142E35-1]|nr:conserved hypothetical protein [Vibrio phage 142E35-1]